MSRARYKRWITQEVRWGDMDAMGHVNNAQYFVYCESARIDFFAAVGLYDHTAGGKFGPALATASCEFKKQVHHPATLDVGTAVARSGRTSFTLVYGMFVAGTEELVAQGESVVVWVDYEAGRSEPIPEAVKTALADYTTQDAP